MTKACSIRIDGDLVARARHDRHAFGQLYRRHYDGVFRYCVHRLFDRHAAEDMTSTVFLKAVAGLDRFAGDEQAFGYWVYRIATNAINDHLRKSLRLADVLRNVAVRLAGRQPAADPPPDETEALQRAILSLRPRYQTVIALRFFEDMKLTEIAGILGSSPATIRSQLSRALVQLRKKLTVHPTGVQLEVSNND